jgi:hypothetical protein
MRALRRRLGQSTPLHLGVAFLVIYALSAGLSLRRHSLAPHFVYLAQSFLRGHLNLVQVPNPPYDLTLHAGRWYVSFPPLPSLLMLPGVALWGLRVSDIAFSVALGALNVTLFHRALERLACGEARTRIWLCVLLGLGTPLWYCAAFGTVWYTAHVAAVTCACLYLRESLGPQRPLWAGLWLGLGFLARPPVLLAFPLALTMAFTKRRDAGRLVRFVLLLGLGAAPALLAQAGYNWARFGRPWEFGYRWMNSPGALLERQATWGQFSLHFLPENLYTLLIRPPRVSLSPLHVRPDPWGMGLLLTMPALLLLLPLHVPPAANARQRARRRHLGWGLGLSILLVSIPSLLYFNTGSYQFGYRFALDWLPLIIPLIAVVRGGALPRWGRGLIVAGAVMHLWGLLWMYPNFNGQAWHVQYVALFQRLIDVLR